MESLSKNQVLNEQIYQRTRRNRNKKSIIRFLKVIDLKEMDKYIEKIIYEPFILPYFRYIMETIPINITKPMKIGTKSVIKIYPNAFLSKINSRLEDFLGTIFHHECFHAKEFFEANPLAINPPPFNSNLFSRTKREIYLAERELRAYQNELKNINKENSSYYIKNIKYQIKKNKNWIKIKKRHLKEF